jgi:hypothetical protein
MVLRKHWRTSLEFSSGWNKEQEVEGFKLMANHPTVIGPVLQLRRLRIEACDRPKRLGIYFLVTSVVTTSSYILEGW